MWGLPVPLTNTCVSSHVRLTIHPEHNPMGPCTSYGPSCTQSHGSMYVLRSILRTIPWVLVRLTVHPAHNPMGPCTSYGPSCSQSPWVHVRLTVHPVHNPMGPCTSYGSSNTQSPWVDVCLTGHPVHNPIGPWNRFHVTLCTERVVFLDPWYHTHICNLVCNNPIKLVRHLLHSALHKCILA